MVEQHFERSGITADELLLNRLKRLGSAIECRVERVGEGVDEGVSDLVGAAGEQVGESLLYRLTERIGKAALTTLTSDDDRVGGQQQLGSVVAGRAEDEVGGPLASPLPG